MEAVLLEFRDAVDIVKPQSVVECDAVMRRTVLQGVFIQIVNIGVKRLIFTRCNGPAASAAGVEALNCDGVFAGCEADPGGNVEGYVAPNSKTFPVGRVTRYCGILCNVNVKGISPGRWQLQSQPN